MGTTIAKAAPAVLMASGVLLLVTAIPSAATDFSGRATYYAPGMGACGWVSTPDQNIVALDSSTFTTALCGRKLTVTYKKKSITVTVVDESPIAPRHGLDLSEGAFKRLASTDDDHIYVTWHWVGLEPAPVFTTPNPWTPQPQPTTPWHPGTRPMLAAQPAPQPNSDAARPSPQPR
ncbi:RlpA-like double-psi beta-barrel domain-containing protein [Kitasatospora sp. NPDC004799]|uniref:RlpA-like double-psi beta-barrel domain-containing protein n=1 Tax=Kitasatospora sp. NPDC004799 TaxID=3154460 RepID=UPI0033BA764A